MDTPAVLAVLSIGGQLKRGYNERNDELDDGRQTERSA
jgi:hypothetical protein